MSVDGSINQTTDGKVILDEDGKVVLADADCCCRVCTDNECDDYSQGYTPRCLWIDICGLEFCNCVTYEYYDEVHKSTIRFRVDLGNTYIHGRFKLKQLPGNLNSCHYTGSGLPVDAAQQGWYRRLTNPTSTPARLSLKVYHPCGCDPDGNDDTLLQHICQFYRIGNDRFYIADPFTDIPITADARVVGDLLQIHIFAYLLLPYYGGSGEQPSLTAMVFSLFYGSINVPSDWIDVEGKPTSSVTLPANSLGFCRERLTRNILGVSTELNHYNEAEFFIGTRTSGGAACSDATVTTVAFFRGGNLTMATSGTIKAGVLSADDVPEGCDTAESNTESETSHGLEGPCVPSCDDDHPTTFSAVGSGFGMTQFNGSHTLTLLGTPCGAAECQWQRTISGNECDTPVNRVALYYEAGTWYAFVEDSSTGTGFKAGPDVGAGPVGTYTLANVAGSGGAGTLVIS